MSEERQSRKLDHLQGCIALADGPGLTRFEDFTPIHHCLPELSVETVVMDTTVAGVKLRHPFIINAITGGAPDVAKVNGLLAEIARETGSAMAVGSQFAALEHAAMRQTYSIVREINPGGIFFANIGAHATPDQACHAVDMIEADALQVHLNPGQELIMPEGDRDFSGYLANIASIVRACPVPVIVKEVGCGISAEAARMLADVGVRAIDVGGCGGTNFLAIEAGRGNRPLGEDVLNWGIPTAISAVEVLAAVGSRCDVVVSGGVRTPLQALKSLILGGSAIAVAGPLVKLLKQQGMEATVDWIWSFIHDLRRLMALTGSQSIQALTSVPMVVTGFSREWLEARGIDTRVYSQRTR